MKPAKPVKIEEYVSRLDEIQSLFKPREVQLLRPKSAFPELLVTVPDSWPHINLRPFYDVHIGNRLHVAELFNRDMAEMVEDPYALWWNGGDMIENVVEGSPGIFHQTGSPQEQFDAATEFLAPAQHKCLFAITGNHEARTSNATGFDIARALAKDLKVHYFPDYCFCTLKWRGNNFRIVAHHGSGAATTAGAQRNAARKELPWTRADFYWTGHLHKPLVDMEFQTDIDQRTSRMVSRCAMIIISPSYVEYFGGWAASKRMGPGIIGTQKATLYPNGDIATEIRVKGKRL